MCRLTAAHKTIRLMLLGPPPDMVHGALLHRTRTPIFRNGSDSRAFVQLHTLRRDNFYYTTQQTEFQVFLQKILFFLQILRFGKRDSESDNKNRKSVLDKPDFFWYTNSNKTETALFPL